MMDKEKFTVEHLSMAEKESIKKRGRKETKYSRAWVNYANIGDIPVEIIPDIINAVPLYVDEGNILDDSFVLDKERQSRALKSSDFYEWYGFQREEKRGHLKIHGVRMY